MSRKLKKRVPVPSFAFVVDGETEIWYLEMLKRNERGINLRIKPEMFRCNQGIKEVAQGVRENGEIFHKER
jgi:hypothetical protein